MKNEINENKALSQTSVSGCLYSLSIEEKYKYLQEKIYENVKTSGLGTLTIDTHRARKVAEMLGGKYDDLDKTAKFLFRDAIVFEKIDPNESFERYLIHNNR
jgi:hypothetical protein